MKRLLVIGAGEAARTLLRDMEHHPDSVSKYEVAGLLDDDPLKKKVLGFPVLGGILDAHRVIREQKIDEVIVAIPSAGRKVVQRIVEALSGHDVHVRIVPGFAEIVDGSFTLRELRDIEPADLLGREEVRFDIERLAPFYQGRTVFVTGAGGSIGSEIFRSLLALPVKRAVAFGHGENSIHQLLQRHGKDPRFSYSIGDVRDPEKLRRELAKYRPSVVFHAAAHKHVPLMEDHPDEAVKNNILGTWNVARESVLSGVERFVLVSTDKAVRPTSVMGATKRVAERIVRAFGASQQSTSFSLVRFGNVLGSRGSVVPIFREQIAKGGPVTVTDPEMVRYFMSIREAARLVIQSVTLDDGPLYVLDMGHPVKIVDLAREMIRLSGKTEAEIPIAFTGMRPGEKINEEVLASEDGLVVTSFDKLLASRAKEEIWSGDELEAVIEAFRRAADCGDKNEILAMIRRVVPEFTQGGAK
jgi:FlaA1/EpsC-like NDP-sugar epimerase